MSDYVGRHIRMRLDTLDRTRAAVAGVQAKGVQVTLQDAFNEALRLTASRLEVLHNDGERFPRRALRRGRRPK